MRKIIIFLTAALIMIPLSGCSQEKIVKKQPIRIGADVFPGWGHVFIAQEKGFFKKNGVDV